MLTLLAVLALGDGAGMAEAGLLGRGLGQGPHRPLSPKAPVYRRPLGPGHHFSSDTRLERFSNRPATDRRRGLRSQSFWTRPHAGREGRADHVRRKFNIPHPVARREALVAKRGTAYHERPAKGGLGRRREVILEERVPGRAIKLREWLRR